MKSNRKQNQITPGTKSGRCPYCGSAVILRSADGIYKNNGSGTMLYACSCYPACDAYVRVLPGSLKPVGSMANGVLRALRREAHRYFDRLYLSGMMTRKEAYEWLASVLQAPLSQAHIGYMGNYYCSRVIDESRRLFESRRTVSGGMYGYSMRKDHGGDAHVTK